jgi:predicted membrane channel-forming protein YqfA (hemolysin III family)
VEAIFAALALALAAVLFGLFLTRRSRAAALLLYLLAGAVIVLVVAFFVALFLAIRDL